MRQTKLASSLLNFWARYKIVSLIDWLKIQTALKGMDTAKVREPKRIFLWLTVRGHRFWQSEQFIYQLFHHLFLVTDYYISLVWAYIFFHVTWAYTYVDLVCEVNKDHRSSSQIIATMY